MNKFIKTDIEQGVQYLKTGIMNVLTDIENGEIDEIDLDSAISLSFIIKCAEERGWRESPYMNWDNFTNELEDDDFLYAMITPNNKYIDICGSLLCSSEINLRVNHDDE